MVRYWPRRYDNNQPMQNSVQNSQSTTQQTTQQQNVEGYENVEGYDNLRQLGDTIQRKEKFISIISRDVSENKRDRRELEKDLIKERSELRRSLERRYHSKDDPRIKERLASFDEATQKRLADKDAVIAQRQSNYDAKIEEYASFIDKYSPETVQQSRSAAPKHYRTGGRGVASLSELRQEKQYQESDKALLREVQERPGIIKGEQFNSQLYAWKYGGGTYTGFTEGTYNGNRGNVVITQRSVPFTSVKSGRTEFKLLPKQQPKTYNAIDLYNPRNRDALRQMSASGEYNNVGALFAGPQYTQNNEISIKPGKKENFSDWAARRSYEESLKFKSAKTPYEEMKYASKNFYYFGLSTGAESTKQGKEFATAVFTGALWRTAETGATRLSELGGKGKGTKILRTAGKGGKFFFGKVAPVVGIGVYGYDVSKRGSAIKEQPEGIERTKAASGLLAKVGLETLGFYAGYKGTSKALPLSAYSTKSPSAIDYVSVQRGTQIVRGTATSPMMLSPAKTTFYSSPTRFEGVRGLFSKPVRTVSVVSSRGGFTQRQFSKGFISVTRQAPGAKVSTTNVYRPGRATRTYRRGDVASSFLQGTQLPAYYTRSARSEKGFYDDTVLLQNAKRVSLFGNAIPTGKKGEFLFSTARQYGSVVSVSRSPLTRVERVTSQVSKQTFKPKVVGKVSRRISDYEFSFTKITKKQMKNDYVYGSRDGGFGNAIGMFSARGLSARGGSPFAVARVAKGYPLSGVKQHEFGHAFAERLGIRGNELPLFKNKVGLATLRKEGTALSKNQMVQPGEFFAGYAKRDRPTEAFAELFKARQLQPKKFKQLAPKLDAMFSKVDRKFDFTFSQRQQSVSVYGTSRQLYGVSQSRLVTAPEAVAQRSNMVTSRLSLERPLPFGENNVAYPVNTLLATKGTPTTRIAYRVVTYGRIERARVGSRPRVVSSDLQQRRINRLAGPSLQGVSSSRGVPSVMSRGDAPLLSVVRNRGATVAVSRLSARSVPQSNVLSPTRALLGVRSRSKVVPVSSYRSMQSPVLSQRPMITPRVAMTPIVRPMSRPAVVQQSRLSPALVSVSRLSLTQLTAQRITTTRVPSIPFPPSFSPPRSFPPFIPPLLPFGGGSVNAGFSGGLSSRRGYKYAPSFIALDLGIKANRGRSQKRVFTGFELRPIR